MEKLELAKAKRRFKETYEYAKDSVGRNEAYPVPDCFLENSFGTDPARVPGSVFGLVKAAVGSEEKNLVKWLEAFDLEPLVQYCKAFRDQTHPFGDMITDIVSLTEDLRDFHAWIEEMRGDSQTLGDICPNQEETSPTDEAHQAEAKEFASLFMEGCENTKNVWHAKEILARVHPLGNAQIANLIYTEKYGKGGCINRYVADCDIWQWLREHGYKVATYQAFNQAMNRMAGK